MDGWLLYMHATEYSGSCMQDAQLNLIYGVSGSKRDGILANNNSNNDDNDDDAHHGITEYLELNELN